MKRYRVLSFDFDSRVSTLTIEIKDDWEAPVIAQHEENRRLTREELIHQFGAQDFESKCERFIELGNKPFSVVAFHNRFHEEIRRAFVMGAFYPALTGACSLGERILNHLVLCLREHYTGTKQYKTVYDKESFDNWELAISTLEAWDVLLPGAVKRFRELAKLRNRAIHFDAAVDASPREMACEAIQCLQRIIREQFGAFGSQPWFMSGTPGEIYIRKEYEVVPFVAEIYIPCCQLVGPRHRLDYRGGVFHVHDDYDYENREVSDEEFAQLRLECK